MKIVVIGAGAMGCLLHQKLRSQHSVWVLPKPDADTRKLTKHYRFTRLTGDNEQIPLSYIRVEQIGDADLIVCALKAYQMAQAIRYISPYLKANCPLILLHNGMGVLQQIRDNLTPNQAIGLMLSTQGARRLSPEHVQHTGQGQWQLGNYQNLTSKNSAVQLLIDQLDNCTWFEEIRTMQWTKLAINSVINPLTAIHNVLNGQLAAPQYQAVIARLIDEVVTQARFANIALDNDNLTQIVFQVIEQTGMNSSSMREDILAGRASEVDYINGYLVKCATASNTLAPENQRCVTQIKSLEQQTTPP
ncbi:ketopantoate reductase family protein [Thalassotalea litorea]|uniref:ketopantoate reductase family protein n=1 Tax=Thalassotalea litorea TaxID=2020715 RepID=UPI0037370738